MPANITGTVYNDLNNNGQFDVGEPGISNAYVILYNQTTGVCTPTITNASGNYSFTINTPQTYTVYETVGNPGATCPPTNFTQPNGFTSSNGPRAKTITVSQTQIDNNDSIVENFGHSTNSNTIPCTTTLIQLTGTPSNWYNVNLVTGESTLQGPLTPSITVNAMGYNVLDSYIYGVVNPTGDIVRIDNSGNVTTLGVPNGLIAQAYNVGTFDKNGFLYLYTTNQANYYVVDLRPNSPTYMKLVDPTNGYIEETSNFGTPISTPINIADWAYNPVDGFLYSVQTDGNVVRIDPTTGQVTVLTTTPAIAGSYGAIGIDATGTMYSIENNSGTVYRYTINGNTSTSEVFSQSATAGQNDATICPNARILVDFGDAPDTTSGNGPDDYTTLLANNGPRHQLINELFLGTQVTGETDAYQNPTATGDDISQGIQDDGVVTPLPVLSTNATTYSLPVTVTNNTGNPANLYGWIDFNKDGLFQGNEASAVQVVPSQGGTQNFILNFTVPAGVTLTPNHTFVRLRLTSDNLTNTNTAPTLEDTRSIGPASDGEVEDYYLTIEQATINAVKSVDRNFADFGDILTYTVTLTNPGTVPVNNVLFTDPVPSGTTYANNLTVSAPFTGTTPQGGLTITTINPGQTVTISWQVKINNAIPNPNPIPNTGTVSFNGATPTNTNTVTTQVNHGEILPQNTVKSADRTVTTKGEVITYTLTFKNTGSTNVNNVVVTDVLDPSLQFEAGSITVNGASRPNDTLSGINVGTLAPNQSATITFKALVIDNTPKDIPNNFTVKYDYTVDSNKPPVSNQITSNTVIVRNLGPKLDITKTGNTTGAIVGDIVRYTLTIKNLGDINSSNVVITDPLTPELQFIGNVTLNGGSINGDITKGINIGNLAVNQTAVLSFDAKVISVPADGVITNTATANYQYTVNPNGPTFNGSDTSNPYDVRVYNASVEITKVANPQNVQVGDVFTYTITAKNTGNIDISNAVLTDVLPPELVVQQITVDGVITNGDIAQGLSIGSLAINQSRVVVLTVKAEGQPPTNPFINVVTGEFEVIVDPNRPPSIFTEEAQDDIGLRVFNPELTLTKKASVTSAAVGDIITYTITAKNTGDIVLNNVIVSDILEQDLKFVQGSVKVNGVASPNESILSGVNIGTLNPGESKDVTFNAEVVSATDKLASNTSSSQFKYTIPGKPEQTGSSQSNKVDIPIRVANIDVIKTSSISNASLGDVITYTVKLINNGDVDALNVLFTDQLPSNVQLVEGSFKVNGNVVNSVNLANGVNIGTVPAGTTTTITYQVKVTGGSCDSKIINSAKVKFSYTLPDGSTGSKESSPSESSSDVIGLNIINFKQLSVEEYLQIPSQKPDIESINSISGTINIVRCHVIETSVATSNEGQNLTGYKLIIHGLLNLVLDYTACEDTQSVHSAHYHIPFSSFIILPEDYSIGSKIDIEGIVEDVYFNDLDCRTFFTNTTLLLTAKILSC